jgi:hypothetical protein
MLLVLGVLGTAAAQTESGSSTPPSLFTSQVPDATITINKHPMGADMVEITMTPVGHKAAA